MTTEAFGSDFLASIFELLRSTVHVGQELTGGLIPLLRINRHQLLDDGLQSRRNRVVDRPRRHHDPVDDLHDDQGDVVPPEGPPGGRHLVEDRSDREEIGTSIDGLTLRLFGRHV
jgi:hypothetical protein